MIMNEFICNFKGISSHLDNMKVNENKVYTLKSDFENITSKLMRIVLIFVPLCNNFKLNNKVTNLFYL